MFHLVLCVSLTPGHRPRQESFDSGFACDPQTALVGRVNSGGAVAQSAEAVVDLRRFGPCAQTRRPRHLGGPDPNHSHLQQSQPPGRRSVRQHHLRAGQRARDGPHETRRPGGTPGPSAQGYPRTEEDQSRARHRPPAGGAVSHPG